jgi:hypothetical protein
MGDPNQHIIDNIMNTNYKIIQDLNTFNSTYRDYINSKCKTNGNSYCSGIYSNLIRQGNIALYDINNFDNQIHTDEFPPINSNLKSDYDTIQSMRSDLDAKMKQLYNIGDSPSKDIKLQYDSVIYTGILISILATTVLYFTFAKL